VAGQNAEHKQILIIEDDDSIRDALQELFSSEGFSVAVAENGRRGLETVLAVRPCVVLLDLMMPVLDGRGFLRELESGSYRAVAGTPVVLITAAGEKGAAGCKVNEILTKPIDIEKLLAVAQKYCRLASSSPTAASP
jgi:two-component system chemotaxis response regulator CheY